MGETGLADAARQLDDIWSRCHVWDLTAAICADAAQLAPRMLLRTLDALHVATYPAARRQLGVLEMLSTDQRVLDAVHGSRERR